MTRDWRHHARHIGGPRRRGLFTICAFGPGSLIRRKSPPRRFRSASARIPRRPPMPRPSRNPVPCLDSPSPARAVIPTVPPSRSREVSSCIWFTSAPPSNRLRQVSPAASTNAAPDPEARLVGERSTPPPWPPRLQSGPLASTSTRQARGRSGRVAASAVTAGALLLRAMRSLPLHGPCGRSRHGDQPPSPSRSFGARAMLMPSRTSTDRCDAHRRKVAAGTVRVPRGRFFRIERLGCGRVLRNDAPREPRTGGIHNCGRRPRTPAQRAAQPSTTWGRPAHAHAQSPGSFSTSGASRSSRERTPRPTIRDHPASRTRSTVNPGKSITPRARNRPKAACRDRARAARRCLGHQRPAQLHPGWRPLSSTGEVQLDVRGRKPPPQVRSEPANVLP